MDKGEKLPVMFWIHGGGFQSGNSDIYRPHYFMDEDVVLVTVNYRLGALGMHFAMWIGQINSSDGVVLS